MLGIKTYNYGRYKTYYLTINDVQFGLPYFSYPEVVKALKNSDKGETCPEPVKSN